MYFKFDPLLNPTFVYGALLRLKQVDWLDKFNTILCFDQDLMWELRKSLPGFQGPIEDGTFWSYQETLEDEEEQWKRPFLIVVNTTYQRHNMDMALWADEGQGDFIIDWQDMWAVATPTAKYK